MRQAVIVVGSSYGDEGKGLTVYDAVRQLGTPCLNILINGGPQRGHTVETPDGSRHVFHHFGSGSAAGAVTYADMDFTVNPLIFCQEREELIRDFPSACLRTVIHPACRVTMPYDMLLNQMIEEARGARRHGSCGLGIFETRRRFETTDWAMHWGELTRTDYSTFSAYCGRIAGEYVPGRLEQLGVSCPPEWREVLESDGLIGHTWADLQEMRMQTDLSAGWRETAEAFPTLIFEAGQGLALDEGRIGLDPHLTPSHTTSLTAARRIAELGIPFRTEVRYVTRTYLTRHGAGPFPTECPADRIAPDLHDRTNVPNPFQQTLRYGMFDGEAVRTRIFADLADSRRVLPGLTAAAVITHLNETGNSLSGGMQLKQFTVGFDRVGYSYDPYNIEYGKQF